jgi:malonyl-CoA decarboxylase
MRLNPRLIAAEAVHTIRSWAGLKQRLGRNRRLFVLTHPALPSEPLVMLQVAITPAVAGSVDALLEQDSWADGPPHNERPAAPRRPGDEVCRPAAPPLRDPCDQIDK